VSPHDELATALEARAAELATRATERMYRDEFWVRRFGERGRRHSGEDARHHLTYLVEALRSGGTDPPAVLVGYARWLRQILVARGMCTRHLVEHFEAIAIEIEIEASGLAGRPAIAALRATTAALLPEARDARAIALAEASLIAQVEARLAGLPFDLEPWTPPDRTRDAIARILSYVIDALAEERAEIFLDHVLFLRAERRRDALDDEGAARQLVAFAEVLAPWSAAAELVTRAVP
jgi:hypothetical protein